MKKIAIISLSVVTSAMLFVGCFDAKPKPTIDEDSLGLRKSSLNSEANVEGSKTNYSKTDAGSGNKFKRAFQDAPPMIPHSVDGMLPITINDNQCTSCHMPEVASSMGATPIPQSHFTNFRPAPTLVDGKKFEKNVDDMKNEVSIKKLETLAGARYNCSQCHAPQSDGQLVENNFKPDYVKPDGENKSSWNEDRLTRGLNTVGDKSVVTKDDLDNSKSKAGTLGDKH